MPEQTVTPYAFARILSRAFCLYLLLWGLSDLLSLPENLPSFIHHLQMPSDSNQRSYWLTYYGTRIVVNIVRATALLILSRYLWKNGASLSPSSKKRRKILPKPLRSNCEEAETRVIGSV